MALLAQHGWGKSNKVEEGLSNNSLDGIIISPKDEKISTLESYINKLRSENPEIQILIDPQFYYATFQIETKEGKLSEYPYYQRELNLSNFNNLRELNKYVGEVLDYQANQSVSGLIAPSIYMTTFSNREAQINLNLISEAVNIKEDEEYNLPLMASLIIHENAFLNPESMEDFLDGLSVLEIDSIYLIIVRSNNGYHQSFDDAVVLSNILNFIYSLSEINEFDIKVGYSDFVGLLYLAVGANDIATGWSQGLRRFTLEQRIILENGGGRRPRLRYSSAPLLNSLLFSEMEEIQTRFEDRLPEFLTNTSYDDVFNTAMVWNEASSLQHHWITISELAKKITNTEDILERVNNLIELINKAQMMYKELEDNYIQLDLKSRGSHLSVWKIALEKFIISAEL